MVLCFLRGREVRRKPNSQTPMEVANQNLNQKPLFKQPTKVNPNFVFLWNAGGNLKKSKSPLRTSQLQTLLRLIRSQYMFNNVFGWDAVLADVGLLHPEAVERRIAVFWASWKRQQQLTGGLMSKDVKTQSLVQIQADRPKTDDTSACPSNLPIHFLLPPPHPKVVVVGRGNVQTHHCLPSQLESPNVTMLMPPLAAAQKNTNTLCGFILLRLTRAIYLKVFSIFVISKCNKLKVDSINRGETEFLWSPSMKGQSFYDAVKKCGNIICHNQQTVDFWVKWIPFGL